MFCYVIMAHADKLGLLRLVARIRELSPESDIIVRHSRADLLDEDDLTPYRARRHLSPVEIVWGDWTFVKAMMGALGHARQVSRADHFVLISGQDYPIRDLATWEQAVRSSGAEALVDTFPEDADNLRYSWHTLATPGWVPGFARRPLGGVVRRTSRVIGDRALIFQGRKDPRWYVALPRRRPLSAPILKGSAWMTLSRRMLDACLVRDAHDGALRREFAHLRITDECYLQTLIALSGLPWLDCPTTYARFTYGDWGALELTRRELDLAASTSAAFARKIAEPHADELRRLCDQLSARTDPPILQDSPVGDLKLTGQDLYPGERDELMASVAAYPWA